MERRRWPRQPDTADELPAPLPPALKSLRFTTRKLAPQHQFDAWQTRVAALVDITLPDGTSPSEGFPADHLAWNLGNMLIVQQRTPPHSYTRSLAKLRASPIDHWSIAITRSGRAWTEVNGRVVESGPGDVELRSLSQPFSGRTTDSEYLIVYLPRDLFANEAAVLDANNNTILHGNPAGLLADYLNSIEARLDTLSATDLTYVAHTTHDLLLACLSRSASGEVASEQPPLSAAYVERARRYIQSNLGSADLSVDAVAKAVGVSRTRLYQMFEPDGGVVHYMQRRRLVTAHAALSDTTDNRRVNEVAEAVGFTSLANFSRAFKKEFGYSPRAALNSASPAELTATIDIVEQEESLSFEDWLKTLGS